jgi:hypothetical protein
MYNNHQHHGHNHGPTMAFSSHSQGLPASGGGGRKPGMINLEKITSNSSSGYV